MKLTTIKYFISNTNIEQSKFNKENLLLFDYNLINIFTFLLGIPIWYLFEGNNFTILKNKIMFDYTFSQYLIITGIIFYIYNYFSLVILNKINPINQLILGIIKRIIIIGISLIFFYEEFSYLKIIGFLFCIIGIILNSLYGQ